jgi:hypothetical protein
VAESLELNFQLRPVLDLWESAMPSAMVLPQSSVMLDFYGPDVDPNHWTAFASNPGVSGKLENSVSDAVSPADIRELPLNGENIYAVLLAEPGVTASNATSRSLGIAANGQRPSSSSFLLDGVEANFNLVSGPLLSVAPEATQEYRLSTNNFYAEYGGAAGYIANAVTRSGGNAWHGVGFFDIKNTVLDANDFQANRVGLARVPDKEDRIGAFVGGPLWKNRLFSGTSIEYFRSRSQQAPATYDLPNSEFLSFNGCPDPSNYACQLLRNYPISNSTKLDPFIAAVTLSQPVSVDQWLGLERLDFAAPEHGQNASVRLASSNLSRPDFIWSPYRDYVSGMRQPVYNVAANWTWALRPSVTNQLAAGWSDERLSWARAHPEVPTIVVGSGNYGLAALLPGSPAAYSLDDSSRYIQLYDNAIVVRDRHILKFGAGGLWRSTNDLLGFGLGGEYLFCSTLEFGASPPLADCSKTDPAIQFRAALARGASTPTLPDLNRFYRSSQYYFFAQDTYRVTARLVLNLGLRYDNFGSPTYAGGTRDWAVQFGAGSTFDQRLANATLVPPTSAPSSLFASDNRDLAPRTGFAYDLSPGGHTVLRGGFGLFYDRLFDNLWLNARNNSFTLSDPAAESDYLPVTVALSTLSPPSPKVSFPNLTAFQPHLRNGYAEDFFLGIQTAQSAAWSIEVNATGSLGRRLITTDVINRSQLVNLSLPAMNYLSNQGLSDYYSLNFVTRWRGAHNFLQAAYSWSHAIDLQSDPLSGDYFNLQFADIGPAVNNGRAAFTTPYDSRGSRASADFDQRQTLVFYSYWQVPRSGSSLVRRILGELRFSQLAAIRSGFPYSIFSPISTTTPDVINAYARPLDPRHALLATPQPVPGLGGEKLFDASAFCDVNTCANASSGRNAFAGPGLINLDISVSRVISLPWLGEAGGLTLRADCFNFLNHANLNPPGNIPGTSTYGIAQFGAPAQTTGFPSLVPLGQNARQVQLMMRLSF